MPHYNWVVLTAEAFRRWTRLPVRDLPSFLNSYQEYYVIGSLDGDRQWILRRMLEDTPKSPFRAHSAVTPSICDGASLVKCNATGSLASSL